MIRAIVRNRPGRGAAVAALCAAFSGCGTEATAAGPAVRDSAGVTIVENPIGMAVETWTLSAEPLLDIGGDLGDPDQELYQVRGALRLDDGRIVVANAGTHELRFYSSEGELLSAVGGEGEGPGEFGGLMALMPLGPDSLLAYDWRNRRSSVFDQEGVFARTVRFEVGEERRFPSPVATMGPDRRTALVSAGAVFFSGEVTTGLERRPTVYWRMAADGTGADSVITLPGWESWVESGEGFVSVRTRPFGKGSYVAPAASGLYAAATERFDVAFHSLDGTLERRIRLAAEPRAVTDADIEAFRRLTLEETSEGRRPDVERTLRNVPYPDVMPAIGDLIVDESGRLWVSDYMPEYEEGAVGWRVFDPEGRYIAAIDLPNGLDVQQIGEDWILGRWTDDFDVEHVGTYRLEREAPAGG